MRESEFVKFRVQDVQGLAIRVHAVERSGLRFRVQGLLCLLG